MVQAELNARWHRRQKYSKSKTQSYDKNRLYMSLSNQKGISQAFKKENRLCLIREKQNPTCTNILEIK